MRISPAVGDAMLRKVSKDSLYVEERKFTFDTVFESDSTQVWHLYNIFHCKSLCAFHLDSLITWTEIEELIFLSLVLKI